MSHTELHIPFAIALPSGRVVPPGTYPGRLYERDGEVIGAAASVDREQFVLRPGVRAGAFDRSIIWLQLGQFTPVAP